MAGQNIDFENGGDSGFRTDTDSIEKYSNTEPIDETVLNRPNENLRYRSEVLRAEGEDTKYRNDADMGWIITGGDHVGAVAPGETIPTVVFDKDGHLGEGKFTISAPIVIQPLATPETDVKELKQYYFTSAGDEARFNFTALLFAFEGMTQRELVWEEVDPGDITANANVIVEGSPLSRIRIQIKDDGTTQAVDVIAAFSAESADVATAGFSVALDPSANDSSTLITLPAEPAVVMAGTAEREMHYLHPSTLSNYLLTSFGIADGDTLAIYFGGLTDPTLNEGRRQTTPTGDGGSSSTSVDQSQLFSTTEMPEKIPYCIPLCKRIGDDLIFIDGTIVRDTDIQEGTVHFGMNGYQVNAAYATTSTPWYDGLYLKAPGSVPFSGVVAEAIDAIISDLARTVPGSGADKVGSDNYVNLIAGTSQHLTHLSVGSIREQAIELAEEMSDKASLAEDEDVTGAWDFNGAVKLAAQTTVDTNYYIEREGALSIGSRFHTKGQRLWKSYASTRTYGETRLIGGFQHRQESEVAGATIADGSIYLGPGHALINGRHVIMEQGVELSGMYLAGSQMYDTSVYPIAADEAKWYYLWLRSDGNFYIDADGPVIPDATWSSTPRWSSDTLDSAYKPRQTHIHGGYDVDDYCLVNVVWACGYDTVTLHRFRGTIPYSANAWGFQRTYVPGTTVEMDHALGAQGASSSSVFSRNLKSTIGVAAGSPGIPLAVTNTAIIQIHGSIVASQGNSSRLAVGYQDWADGVRPSYFTHMYYHDIGFDPGYQQYVGSDDNPEPGGIVTYPHVDRTIAGGRVQFENVENGSITGSWSFHLLGFEWNRFMQPGEHTYQQ